MIGGTTNATARTAGEPKQPQWSPPTRRRDDGKSILAPLGDLRAPMEPADEQRDDGLLAPGAHLPAIAPQWSPPTSGGTTAREIRAT